MGLLGEMVVSFGVDLTNFNSGIGRAKGLLGSLASNPLVDLGVGLAVVGVASVKMAADFQTAILSLVAHAGLAKSEIGNVSAAVLKMSTEVGRSPTELADALYPILSAFSGITNQSAKSALALATLRLSFQAVAGTTTSGTAVALAAVGTFNSLGLATNNAAENTRRMTALMDTMDLTVQLGNMRWEQYKNVISKLAVSIQGTNVTFNEASAALAEMTNEGFSAQKAQTYLSNTFNTLEIKTDSLAKHAKKLGISFDEAKYGPMTLAEKIQYLNEITGGNRQELLALMGNNATALKTFNALSTGLDGYKNNLKSLQNAHGALASSFATASQGFNFHMEQLKAAGSALMITFGTMLLPALTNLVSIITPLITKFTDWETHTHGIEKGFGALVTVITNTVNIGKGIYDFFTKNQLAGDLLIGTLAGIAVAVIAMNAGLIISAITSIPAIVVAFGAWAVAAGAAAIATIVAAAPFIAIGIVVALVVAGIILAVQHWGAISAWLQATWQKVWDWMKSFWGGLGDLFHKGIAWIGGIIQSAGKWLYNTFIQPFVDAWHFISQVFSMMGKIISDLFSANWGALFGDLHAIGVPGFASGVQNFQGGLAMVGERGPELVMLPRGSSVYPLQGSSSAVAAGGGSSRPQTITIEFDGREMARYLIQQSYADVRLRLGPGAIPAI